MEFTKKIKVPIGSVPKVKKTMGTLIFLVNSKALHQKHLCIFVLNSEPSCTVYKYNIRPLIAEIRDRNLSSLLLKVYL